MNDTPTPQVVSQVPRVEALAHTRPSPDQKKRMFRWLRAMHVAIEAVSWLSKPDLLRPLGDEIKDKLREAIKDRNEELVLEVYFRLAAGVPWYYGWREAVWKSDWSLKAAGREWVHALDEQIDAARGTDAVRGTDEVIALAQALRKRLLTAVRAGEEDTVLTLCWCAFSDEEYPRWKGVICQDPAFQNWYKAQTPTTAPRTLDRFEQELLGIHERMHEMYSRLDVDGLSEEKRVSDLKFLSERLRGILSEEERKAALGSRF